VIAQALNVAGLDGRGTWYLAVGNTTGSGPHFNLEEFIGSAIIQILHHDAAAGQADWPKGLRQRLEQCLIGAVECSLRRNVRLSYTNPVAMGIECSALTGEMLKVPRFCEYARRRLAEWRRFTERAGTFEEFNSSCYGGVTLPHIAYLAEWVRDRDIRAAALYMERLYFDHICDFFHAPTGELSPPQARAYSDRFAGTQLHDYLSHVLEDCGLGEEARLAGVGPPPARRRLGKQYYCHATAAQMARLLRGFGRPLETRVFCEWIGRDHVGPLQQVPPPPPGPHTRRRELVNWRRGDFCIGSVNEVDSWEQRRALGGFIAAGNGSAMIAWKPLIAVRGTHRDEQQRRWPTLMYFNLCCGQHEGTVLAGVSGMPVDGGWLCGSHWRQQVSGRVEGISADFGFDLTGLTADRLPPLAEGEVWRLEIGGCAVSLLLMGGHVGQVEAAPVVRKTDAGWRISFLRLEDFTLNWSRPPEVGIAFLLDISPKDKAPEIGPASWRVSGPRLDCRARVGRSVLHLRYHPPKMGSLTRKACHFLIRNAPKRK
jgi:hypothetical protein